MTAMTLGTGWQRASAAALGVGALLVAVGCGTQGTGGVSAQSLTANQAGMPVIVTCEPHQRTLVRPVVVDGQMAIRPMMYLALTYDHRIVDGKEAVTFLVRVKESLEDPQRLMLEL